MSAKMKRSLESSIPPEMIPIDGTFDESNSPEMKKSKLINNGNNEDRNGGDHPQSSTGASTNNSNGDNDRVLADFYQVIEQPTNGFEQSFHEIIQASNVVCDANPSFQDAHINTTENVNISLSLGDDDDDLTIITDNKILIITEPIPNQETVLIKEAATEKNETPASVSKRSFWDQLHMEKMILEGHSGNITCVTMNADYIVTASVDKTVKVWTMTGQAYKNLEGHTSAIMALCLLNKKDSSLLLNQMNIVNEHYILMTAGLDCEINTWALPSGNRLKSIPATSPIYQIGYERGNQLIIIGTEDGKVESYDPIQGLVQSSVNAYDMPIAGLKVQDDTIICSDTTSLIKFYKIKEGSLFCTKTTNAVASSKNSLTGLTLTDTSFITGHITGSFKMTKMATGVVKRRETPFKGKVDDVCVDNDTLFVSSSDNNSSYINIYEVNSLKYLGTIADEGTVASIAALKIDNGWRIVAGGRQLRVWETYDLFHPSPKDSPIKDEGSIIVSMFPEKEQEIETDSEDEDAVDNAKPGTSYSSDTEEKKRSWCNVM